MRAEIKKAILNGVGEGYLQRVYRNHARICRDARSSQNKLFTQFQRQLSGTALAKDLELHRFSSLKAFTAAFPAQPYEFYAPYVQRIMNGEPRVMYGDPTPYFFVTSGSSGFNRKIIPCNDGMKHTIARFQQKVLSALLLECDDFRLTSDRFAYGSRASCEPVNGIPRDYISGILTSLIPDVLKEYVVPSQDTLGLSCRETKLRDIIRESQHRDIRLVSGVPAYLIHVFKEMIEALHVSCLKDLWPNLEMCVYSGTSVHQYMRSLNQLAGVDLNYFGCYVATESPLGMEMPSLVTHKGNMVFVPDLILYSFHDVNSKCGVPLLIDELRAGGEYLVNLGTPNGFIHYAINDYIKVLGAHPHVEFELMGRYDTAINAAAEKVSETQIARAIQLVQEHLPARIEHYFVYPSEAPDGRPGYSWVIAADAECSTDHLAQPIDEALMTVSADYREARLDARVLAPPTVTLIPAHLIRRLFERHKNNGQFKMNTTFQDRTAFQSFYETQLLIS